MESQVGGVAHAPQHAISVGAQSPRQPTPPSSGGPNQAQYPSPPSLSVSQNVQSPYTSFNMGQYHAGDGGHGQTQSNGFANQSFERTTPMEGSYYNGGYPQQNGSTSGFSSTNFSHTYPMSGGYQPAYHGQTQAAGVVSLSDWSNEPQRSHTQESQSLRYPAPPPSRHGTSRRPASARSSRTSSQKPSQSQSQTHKSKKLVKPPRNGPKTAAVKDIDRLVEKEIEEQKMNRLHSGLPVTNITQVGAKTIARKAGAALAQQLQESDYLVYHWRHASRESQREAERLRDELHETNVRFMNTERRLLERIQELEQTTAHATIIATRVEEEASPLRAVVADLQEKLAQERGDQSSEINKVRAEVLRQENLAIEQKHLRTEMKLELDEMRKIYHEHNAKMDDVKIQTAKAIHEQEEAAHRVNVAERIRDELLDKLEAERSTVRMLCQQLDLIAETYTNYSEYEKLFNKVVYSGGSESNRIKEVEALRGLMNKHTRDRGWQERKATILGLIRKKQMNTAMTLNLTMKNENGNKKSFYNPSSNVALRKANAGAGRSTSFHFDRGHVMAKG